MCWMHIPRNHAIMLVHMLNGYWLTGFARSSAVVWRCGEDSDELGARGPGRAVESEKRPGRRAPTESYRRPPLIASELRARPTHTDRRRIGGASLRRGQLGVAGRMQGWEETVRRQRTEIVLRLERTLRIDAWPASRHLPAAVRARVGLASIAR